MSYSWSRASSTVITSWPCMHAWSAQMGSTSATATRACCPRSDWALPLPTSPNPQTSAFLPESSTSVARLIASTSECRQPYRLSNLLLVTESLTLMAGNSSRPSRRISYSRCTPVVVSSDTPRIDGTTRRQKSGRAPWISARIRWSSRSSSAASASASGSWPAFSYSTPRCAISVASPPSSTISVGPWSPGKRSAWRAHHQYSSSVSPFHAKTATPSGRSAVPLGPTATAAAAWSCVEKMLHDAQRTSAPSSTSVSIRTAVWTVMCSDPVIRAPLSGVRPRYSSRSAMRPGISCSASSTSLRPNATVRGDRSATLNGRTEHSSSPPNVAAVRPSVATNNSSSGVDSAVARGGRHPLHRLDVRGHAHRQVALQRDRQHLAEGPLHDRLQLLVDLVLGPEERLQVLHPLEVADRDPACVGQDVRHQEHAVLAQDRVGLGRGRPVGALDDQAGPDVARVARRD